jgi:hypothetical protein
MSAASVAPSLLGPPIPRLAPDAALPVAPIGPPKGPLPRPPAGPRPLLPGAPAIFPWLARRFAPGEATLWIGPDGEAAPLLELLYAGIGRAGGAVSLVEGANHLHPYRVAEAGRTLGIDPADLLRRVRLARAFTAYQLVALVDGWAREVRRARPTLLVAHDLPHLFGTDDFPAEERGPLLEHIAGRLRALAEESGRPLLLTLPGGPATFPGLSDRGPRFYDVVRLVGRPGRPLRLEAYREASGLSMVPRPDGQRGLEEFAPDPREEVMRWAGPPPRTARRSRSG